MDKRTVAGTLFSLSLGGGASALIAVTALPSDSVFINLLVIGGSISVTLGLIGLAWLYWTSGKEQGGAKATADHIVTSHHQSGGVTAHTVNFGPLARKLNPDLKNDLLSLPRDQAIIIRAVMGDAEAVRFANHIYDYMKAEGLPVSPEGVHQGMFPNIITGLHWNASTSTITVGSNELA